MQSPTCMLLEKILKINYKLTLPGLIISRISVSVILADIPCHGHLGNTRSMVTLLRPVILAPE